MRTPEWLVPMPTLQQVRLHGQRLATAATPASTDYSGIPTRVTFAVREGKGGPRHDVGHGGLRRPGAPAGGRRHPGVPVGHADGRYAHADQFGGGGGLQASEADAHRPRVVLEGTREVTWPEGRRLTPAVKIGVRHDWGDAETGFGLELGGRMQYADPAPGPDHRSGGAGPGGA